MPKPPSSTSKVSRRPPRVALLIETSNGYAREMLRGVEDYMRSHGPWSIYIAEHGRGDAPPPWFENWKGDGIIARIENRRIANMLGKNTAPVVDISSYRFIRTVPSVVTDGQGIAELAMTHFINRGFRNFAYCGMSHYPWSCQRESHFSLLLKERDMALHSFNAPKSALSESESETEAIAQWLLDLPKPLAVFACYDARGRQVLDACHRANLAVPEEVAVLGVDDDHLLCELSPQPLSSIDPNARASGWLAASLLDQMMNGEKIEPEMHVVKAIGVTVRQSTDVFAVDDDVLVKSLRFIRENATRGIGVEDVARAAGVSRRSLESRMNKMLKRGPHEEILRVQIKQSKHLLLHTNLSIADVAERCGFDTPEYFSVAFKRMSKQAPGAYRKSRGDLE